MVEIGPLWAEDCEDCDGAGHHHVRSYAELDAAADAGIAIQQEIDDCTDCPICACCDGIGYHEYPDFMALRILG